MGITGQDQVRLSSNASFASLLQPFPLSTTSGLPNKLRSFWTLSLSGPLPPSPCPTQTPSTNCRIKISDPCSPYRSSNLRPKTSSRNLSTSNSACANSKSKYRKKGHSRPWRAWLVGDLFPFCASFSLFFRRGGGRSGPFLVFGFGDFGFPVPRRREPEWFGEVRVVELFGCTWCCMDTRIWCSQRAESGGERDVFDC